MSLKPRQRSEISLSLASVLVIRVKSRKFSLKVLASAIGPCLALGLIRALQQFQRRLDCQLLAIHLEAQVRHGLIEQAVPGPVARLRFFEEQLLELVVELIGLLLAQIFDPRPVMSERRNLHGLFKGRIVDPVELQFEEQQQRGNIGVLGVYSP